MSMEIAQITQQTFDALKPALPFLTAAGGVGAARAMGKDAWEQAKGLWSKLRGTDEAMSQALVKAAERVVARPDDDDAAAALRAEVRDVLEANPVTLRDVVALLEAAGPRMSSVTHVTQTGDGAVAVGAHAKAVGKGGMIFEGDVHRGVKIVEIKDRVRRPDDDD